MAMRSLKKLKQSKHVRTDITAKSIQKSVQNMTRNELAKQAKSLFSTVNKRIDRLLNADGVVSPALQALQKKRVGNLHFTSGGKNLKELQKEYAQAIAFYNATTSTVTGARKFTNKLSDMIGERVKDKKFVSSFFEVLHAVSERVGEVVPYGDLLNDVIEETRDKDLANITNSEREYDKFIADLVVDLTNNSIDEFNKLTSAIDAFSGNLW